MKLSNGTFKHIEGELYFYHETRQELRGKKEELLHGRGPSRTGTGGVDPTGEKAISILSNRRITHMERIVQEIDAVYQALPKDKRRLVKLLYWTRPQVLTWDGIACKLNISKRQAQRWRRTIVEDIAVRMGWR